MACFVFFAVLTGKVSHAAAPVLACWMMGGFFCQLVAGIIELKDHNIVGGNVFVFFAAFFMFVTSISLATKYGLSQAGLPMDTRIEGWGWLAGAAFLIAVTPCYLKSPKPMFILVVLVDVALICIVALDLKLDINRAMFAQVAAWSLFVAGWIGVYMVGAITMNTHFGKTILPIPSPFVK
jgi:succinate-acetate transporter protein